MAVVAWVADAALLYFSFLFFLLGAELVGVNRNHGQGCVGAERFLALWVGVG